MKIHNAITTIFTASVIASSISAIALPASAQTAEEQYAAVLEEIANVRLSIVQSEAYIESQKAEIASLEGQIKDTGALIKVVDPMLENMAAAIEVEIQKDIPFRSGERYARLDKLKADIADEANTPGNKMRSALLIYDIEVGYGQSLEAYGGNHPVSPGTRLAACEADIAASGCALEKALREKMDAGASLRDIRNEVFDGSYLRYGRLALAYQQFDGSQTLRYDVASKEWVELNSSQALEVERGLRTARGEAAPSVVNAPVYVTN